MNARVGTSLTMGSHTRTIPTRDTRNTHPDLVYGFPPMYSRFTPVFVSTMSTTTGNSAEVRRPTYNPISDVELVENFMPGGYHPIMVGDMLHGGRYRVVDKFGFGS